ncbi:MAG: SCO family protein [Betaproteobacteria bacterium]|nr:SCO family protein [Betaproteobacteria bacterium]
MRRFLPLYALLTALVLAACSQGNAPRFNATDITGVDYGKNFALTDHNGQPRTLADFRGKVVTLFFGYTQCPDVCPTSLAMMAETLRQIGPDAGRVQVLFVSVDPERDTPELLRNYLPAFNPGFLGLHGDAATIAALARDFKVFYQKQAGASASTYTIDHSAGTYVFDPEGRLRLYVRHGEEPAKVAGDIRVLLKGG